MFAIFSTTKAITGTAILQCVEDGELDLDAPAKTYVPEIGQLVHELRETTQNLNAVSGKLEQGGAGALLGGQRLPDYEPGKQNHGKK